MTQIYKLVNGDKAPATSYEHSHGRFDCSRNFWTWNEKTNKKKTEGEEKVLIYMKESQVESSPECPEWSSIRSPLPVKED